MIGDIYIIDGVEYEVVFDGKQSLLPERPSRPLFPPDEEEKRKYNKTGKYSGKSTGDSVIGDDDGEE